MTIRFFKGRNSCPLAFGIMYRRPDIRNLKITTVRCGHTDIQTDLEKDFMLFRRRGINIISTALPIFSSEMQLDMHHQYRQSSTWVQACMQTGRQACRYTGRQAGRQVGRQINRQVDRQLYMYVGRQVCG